MEMAPHTEELFITFHMALMLGGMSLIFWYGLLTARFVISIAVALTCTIATILHGMTINLFSFLDISIATYVKDGIFTCCLITTIFLFYGIYWMFFTENGSKEAEIK